MARVQEPSAGPRAELARARDAALRRISHTRRWTFAGAAALSAGLAALASALLPGKSFGAHRTSTTVRAPATSSTVTPPLPAPATAAQLGITSSGVSQQGSAPQPQAAPQPVPAPQPAPQPQVSAPAPAPVVVSGGS